MKLIILSSIAAAARIPDEPRAISFIPVEGASSSLPADFMNVIWRSDQSWPT